MERMDIRLGGERITDVHELYQNILESHHGDEKEALRMMCFLHQGVMAGFLKEVFLHYAEGDLSTSQYMLLQRNHQDPYDVEEGELTIDLDLDHKSIEVSNHQYLYSMDGYSPRRAERRIDLHLRFNLRDNEAYKFWRSSTV